MSGHCTAWRAPVARHGLRVLSPDEVLYDVAMHQSLSEEYLPQQWHDQLATEVDARGMLCPMPLLKAKRALNGLDVGGRLLVVATDQGSVRDFRVFSQQSGHALLYSGEIEGTFVHLLQKEPR